MERISSMTRGHAAGIVEILRGPVAGGADVEQIVRPAVHPVEGVSIDLDAELVRDGGQVHQSRWWSRRSRHGP